MRIDNESIYGEMPKHMETVVANALLKEDTEMAIAKKRLVAMALAAILVVAMACTALAISLSKSRYDATKAARDAVMTKYGLTVDTIILFQEEKAEVNGVWTVVYTPWKYNPEPIGIYTVTVAEGQAPVTSWTHDGVDITGDGLDAAVWGPKQLEQVLALEKAQYAPIETAAATDAPLSHLVRAAERDKMLLEAGLDVFVMNLVPGPDDIPEEEALALMKQAIVGKYGIPLERIERLPDGYTMFLKYQGDDEPVYRLHLQGEKADLERFSVWLYSPSGRVGYCNWDVHPQLRALPEGPLDGYEEAVKEFVEEGAFDVRSPEEKAKIAARITEAGYGELIGNRAYLTPGDGDITETAALAAAEKAMQDTYGFTDDTLSLFAESVSLLDVEGRRVWYVGYRVMEDGMGIIGYYTQGEHKVGEYSVTLSADTGNVVEITWSLQKKRGDTKYTESDWGQAPAYDAQILSWMLTLEAAIMETAPRNEEDWFSTEMWSLERRAVYDELYRNAGFNAIAYPCGLPGEGDITQEQAMEIAKQALRDDFQYSEERLNECDFDPSFYVNDPTRPVWSFTVHPVSGFYQDTHVVRIDAKTGEVIDTEYVPVGNG